MDIPALQEHGTAFDLDAADCATTPQLLGAAFTSNMTWDGMHLSEVGFFDFLNTRLHETVLEDDDLVRRTAVITTTGWSASDVTRAPAHAEDL